MDMVRNNAQVFKRYPIGTIRGLKCAKKTSRLDYTTTTSLHSGNKYDGSMFSF